MRKSFSGALAFSAAAGLAIAALVSFGVSATASDAAHGAQQARMASSQGPAAAGSTPASSASASASASASGSGPGSGSVIGGAADDTQEVQPVAAKTSPDGRGVTPVPLTERQTWLVFQDLVRQCMSAQGFDYLYFEWWNPIYQTDDMDPSRPRDMTPDESAAWDLALFGNSGLGADYRWQDAGCWGAIVEQQGTTN